VTSVSLAPQDVQDLRDLPDFKVQWEQLESLGRLEHAAGKEIGEIQDLPEPQVKFFSYVFFIISYI